MRRIAGALFVACAAGCGGSMVLTAPPAADGPTTIADPIASALCASADPGQTITAQGEMEGIWAGRVELVDDVTIAEGKTLEVCPGTIVSPQKGTAKIFVNGTLTFEGSKTAMIEFEENQWSGIHVMGKLNGGYVKLNSVQTCIEGKNESQIDLVGAQ